MRGRTSRDLGFFFADCIVVVCSCRRRRFGPDTINTAAAKASSFQPDLEIADWMEMEADHGTHGRNTQIDPDPDPGVLCQTWDTRDTSPSTIVIGLGSYLSGGKWTQSLLLTSDQADGDDPCPRCPRAMPWCYIKYFRHCHWHALVLALTYWHWHLLVQALALIGTGTGIGILGLGVGFTWIRMPHQQIR